MCINFISRKLWLCTHKYLKIIYTGMKVGILFYKTADKKITYKAQRK